MRERVATFRRNARTIDIVKVALFLPFFLGISLMIYKGEKYVIVALSMILSVLAPWLIRDWLVDRLDHCFTAFNCVPIIMTVVLALLGRRLHTPNALYAMVTAIGFYVGVFWWVLSDPRVETEWN